MISHGGRLADVVRVRGTMLGLALMQMDLDPQSASRPPAGIARRRAEEEEADTLYGLRATTKMAATQARSAASGSEQSNPWIACHRAEEEGADTLYSTSDETK